MKFLRVAFLVILAPLIMAATYHPAERIPGIAFTIMDSSGTNAPRKPVKMTLALFAKGAYGGASDTLWTITFDSINTPTLNAMLTDSATSVSLLATIADSSSFIFTPPTGDSVYEYSLSVYVQIAYDTAGSAAMDAFYESTVWYSWKTGYEDHSDADENAVNYYINRSGSNANSGKSWDEAWYDLDKITTITDSTKDRVNIFIAAGDYGYNATTDSSVYCTVFVDNTHIYGAGIGSTRLRNDSLLNNSLERSFYGEYIDCLADSSGAVPDAGCFSWNPAMFMVIAKDFEITGMTITTNKIPDTVAAAVASSNVCLTEPVFSNAIQLRVDTAHASDGFWIHHMAFDNGHKMIGSWPRGVAHDGTRIVVDAPLRFGVIEDNIFDECECHAIDIHMENGIIRNNIVSNVGPSTIGSAAIQLIHDSKHVLIEGNHIDSAAVAFQMVGNALTRFVGFRNNMITDNILDAPVVMSYSQTEDAGVMFDDISWGYVGKNRILDIGLMNGSFEMPVSSVLDPPGWTSLGPDLGGSGDSAKHRQIAITGYSNSGNWGFYLSDEGTEDSAAKLRTEPIALQTQRYLLKFSIREDSDVSGFDFRLYHADSLTVVLEDTTNVDAGSNTWSNRTIEFTPPRDGSYIIEISTNQANETSDAIVLDDFTLTSMILDWNVLNRVNYRNTSNNDVLDSIVYHYPGYPDQDVMKLTYLFTGTKVDSTRVEYRLITRED